MLINKDTLKALYSDDLPTFLEKACLKDSFDKGKIQCIYCSSVISEKNLYALIPNNDHLDFCCTNADCIFKLSQEAKK